MRRLLVLLLVVAGVVVVQAPALACSCADWSQRQQFESADVVFSGTATAGEPVGDPPPPGEPAPSRPMRWTFSVDDEQKGDVGESANVMTSGDSASCGYDFQTGRRYQVFADRQDGRLWTGLCSGTHELGAGDEPYEPQQQQSPSPSGSPSPTDTGSSSPSPSVEPTGSESPSADPTGSASPTVAPTGGASPTSTAGPLPQTGGGVTRLAGYAALLALGALLLGVGTYRRRAT